MDNPTEGMPNTIAYTAENTNDIFLLIENKEWRGKLYILEGKAKDVDGYTQKKIRYKTIFYTKQGGLKIIEKLDDLAENNSEFSIFNLLTDKDKQAMKLAISESALKEDYIHIQHQTFILNRDKNAYPYINMTEKDGADKKIEIETKESNTQNIEERGHLIFHNINKSMPLFVKPENHVYSVDVFLMPIKIENEEENTQLTPIVRYHASKDINIHTTADEYYQQKHEKNKGNIPFFVNIPDGGMAN